MGDLIITCNDLLWAGHPNLAIEHFEKALRMNPLRKGSPASFGMALGHFFARRSEKAVAMLLLWV